MSKKLITSALPYVNNVPHLGNIIGCVLSADVYARFCRQQGYETLYICATDEYGTATEKKALDEGLTPREICDKYHAIHKKVYEAFNIDFDAFGRTSNPEHIKVTQDLFKALESNGNVQEQTSEQSYCEHDQMFLADRYVEGVCPHCGYEEARGDQCDACGKLLQPTELKDPKCQVCGNTPTTKSTRHLYIDLPKLESELVQFQEESLAEGSWVNNAVSTTRSWVERGLLPRPITRDLKWGVPVPKVGFENKVFYVWFDAPIGYISATKRAFPETWKDWWFDPKNTELYQFMAKDNIPFHTVVFPAAQLGSGQDWTMLHHINSTEYLNYEGTKFSKSRHIGVFGTDVIELGLPIDLWRFYLLFNRPEKSDTNFSWDGFLEDVNSSFIDNIGNLLNRVMVFFQKNYEGGSLTADLSEKELNFLDQVKTLTQETVQSFEAVRLRDALRSILAIGKLGNKMFHESEPWKTIKEDKEKTKSLLVALTYALREIGILLFPYMPETSGRILKMLGQEGASFQDLGDFSKMDLPGKPEILFQKLQKKAFESYKEKFSGEAAEEEEKIDPLEAFQKIEVTVGKIIEIDLHPSAERLYVEKVDLGNGDVRSIVSGLVKYYEKEELLGKNVLVASNLAAANLRGVDSQGMVLAVEKRKKLEVPMVEAEIGTKLSLCGEEPAKAPVEITIDEFFDCPLKVEDFTIKLEGKELCLNGQPVKTTKLETGKVS